MIISDFERTLKTTAADEKQALTESFVRSFVHSFGRSFVGSFIRSLVLSFVRSFAT